MSFLDNTVKLAVMSKAWASQPQGCGSGRVGPVLYVLQHQTEWTSTLTGQHSAAGFGGMVLVR